jgi:protein-S-isoprenylcysteine O-methyltransferase Ste14
MPLTDSPWIMALLIPVLLVMHYGVIRPEERHLQERFGDEFRDYQSSVRRWL